MEVRANRDSAEARPHRTHLKGLIKWFLGVTWLFVVLHVCLDPDGRDDFEDPTFDAPAWEGRTVARENTERDSYSVGDATGDIDAESVHRRRDRDGVGGASEDMAEVQSSTRAATDVSADATGDAADDLPTVRGDTTTAALPANAMLEPPRLVEVVQPARFDKCCVPAALVNTQNPKDVDCFGTCYTARACSDPNYPFESEEEKSLFPMANLTNEGRKMFHAQCKFPQTARPPVEWCQAHHVAPENDTAAHLVAGIPPAGCSQVLNAGGSGAFQHVLLFPAAKLAFCGIPKVGITQWEQFLRFYFGAQDYPALPHYKLDRNFFQFDKLAPRAQKRIWEDEAWTWAAFVRDPAERLLSAFLDKVNKKGSTLTFDAFVNSLSEVYSCGMSERLDRFQFIGELHQAADQTRELLGHVGMWESHGRHFIQGGVKAGRSPWCNVRPRPLNRTQHLGFQQKDQDTNASAAKVVYGHARDSRGKMGEYFTPSLLHHVREKLYPDDYKLWQLVNDNGARLSKGVELASQLSQKCHGAHVVMPLP